MRIKSILFLTAILLFGTAHADYKFDYISIGVSSITDNSLGTEIEAKGLGFELVKEMDNKFLIGGAISATGYDDASINGIYFDASSVSTTVAVGKYAELSNIKIVGYVGVRANQVEIVVDTVRDETDDTGLVGSFGFIAPLSDRFDFLMLIGVDTLYDETDTSTTIGGSYDLSDQLSLEGTYGTADEVDVFTFTIRFNFL